MSRVTPNISYPLPASGWREWLWIGAMSVVVAFLLMLAGLFAIASGALAHDHWIALQKLRDPITNQWCCDERDTREETTNVKAVPGGFLIISTGEVIPNERVIWKSPGGWWRSRNLSDGTTRCLIGPPQGS